LKRSPKQRSRDSILGVAVSGVGIPNFSFS
jgi:hypothetical protein